MTNSEILLIGLGFALTCAFLIYIGLPATLAGIAGFLIIMWVCQVIDIYDEEK